MRWPWRLNREWAQRAERAEAEAEHSRRELERAREQVLTPLARWRQQNHFAELIRASLLEGKDHR